MIDHHDAGVTMAQAILERTDDDASQFSTAYVKNAKDAVALLRAIVVENVTVRREETALWFPAGPHFRLEREIKNAITIIAKTNHYWQEHVAGLSSSRH